jgi:GxxExxY protein
MALHTKILTGPPVPVEYKGTRIECGYRIDLLVDDAVIVELKSVDQLAPIHEAQLLTYMKLARIRTGLLINFNQQRLVDGLRRFKF